MPRKTDLLLRYSEYYEQVLRNLNHQYLQGSESKIVEALSKLDSEWSQIEKAFHDVAKLASTNKFADHLCGIFPDAGSDIILHRISPSKRIEWLSKALETQKANLDLQARAAILQNFGNAYTDLGDYPKALAAYQDSMELSPTLPDQTLYYVTLYSLSNLYLQQGHSKQALEYLNEVMQYKGQLKNYTQSGFYISRGNIYFRLQKYGFAKADYDTAWQLAIESGDLNGQIFVLKNLSNYFLQIGDFEKAEQHLYDAQEICQRLGNIPSEVDILHSLALIKHERKNYQEAITEFNYVLEVLSTYTDLLLEATCVFNLAQVFYAQGQYQNALPYLERAMLLNEQMENHQETAKTSATLAFAYCATGRSKAAIEMLQKSIRLYQQLGDSERIAYLENNINAIQQLQQNPKAHFHLMLEEPVVEFRLLFAEACKDLKIGCSLGQRERKAELEKGLELLEDAIYIFRKYGFPQKEAEAQQIINDIYNKLKALQNR